VEQAAEIAAVLLAVAVVGGQAAIVILAVWVSLYITAILLGVE